MLEIEGPAFEKYIRRENDSFAMKKAIKFIWNTITTIIVILMIALIALLWGSKLIGYEALIVQSGSMEPNYHVGSLVYVKAVEPETLKVGDVITFELGGGVYGTHRIVEVVRENGTLSFVTKGDANEVEDQNPVLAEDIMGQVKFTIPELGFLVNYIQQPPGTYIAICAVALILLLTIIPDFIFSENSGEKKK